MSIKQLRLDRGWSQEHLSQVSGLSVRTVQRIEQGNKAGLESLKALASVFEINISDLTGAELNESELRHSDANATDHIAFDSNSMDAPLLKKTRSEDKKMESKNNATAEARVIAQVKRIKGFYKNLAYYMCIVTLLFAVNLFTNPAYIWAIWPALGWGIAIVLQGLSAFDILNFFGSDWEKKQIAKRLDKNTD